MELVDFLRARFDEDADIARGASPGPWRVNAESDEVLAVDDITVAEGFALSGRQLHATTEHIARHDPARVLADVDAKRRILDKVVPRINEMEDQIESEWGWSGEEPESVSLLRLLALPYADHQAYRQEWRP